MATTEREWAAFWERHAGGDGSLDRPEADFANETVVAVVLGQKPNACWNVRVTNATFDPAAGTVRVEVTTYEPAGGMCAAVVVHPHHFVALPVADATVEFEERSTAGRPPE